VIWLWKGMAGDTEVVNGHVDNMACFIRPGVVAISWTEDKFDPQYECSSRNVEILESTPDARGRKIEVIKVPCPPPMFRTHHEADTIDVRRVVLSVWRGLGGGFRVLTGCLEGTARSCLMRVSAVGEPGASSLLCTT
jgi:hypothetical protein